MTNDAVSAADLRRELDEVRASRTRLAAATDAERRRIERGLHDSVQQDLIALAVKLQLAREVIETEPAEARAFLEEASRDVHDALDGVRAIAQLVYPSLLIDLGLAEALRGAARASRTSTQVDATSERFPPEVEAAVYFSCVQAIEGAEPPAARAHIRIWPEETALVFEVTCKCAAAPDVSGIEDRVGSVAGSVDASSVDGLFRLRGSIPVAR